MRDPIHDLGGKHGHGPVKVEQAYLPFHARWEGVTHAIMMECSYDAPIDWTRHVRELSVPADYFDHPYYLSWAMTYAVLLLQSGRLSLSELLSGEIEGPVATPARRTSEEAEELQRVGAECFDRPLSQQPTFAVGALVRTRQERSEGHTRLPGYARGAKGRVTAHHRAHVLPDDMSRGVETAAHLYTVAFEARALFGVDADGTHTVMLDLWEPYLEAAQ